VTALDSLIRPVVIHRIVGTVVQANGEVYYKTKGDNNQYVDPQLAEADHVLGVPIATIPQGGILILFAESPEGLVALIGMIALYYLGKYEVKMKDDETKEKFLGELTTLVLGGKITAKLFERLEPVVRYGKHIQVDGVDDGLISSLLTWMRKGGLERGWTTKDIDCPDCPSKATTFVTSKNLSFTVCQNCANAKASLPPVLASPIKA